MDLWLQFDEIVDRYCQQIAISNERRSGKIGEGEIRI